MKNDLIAQTGVCLANSSYLREWFALQKVPVYLETTLTEVREDSIVCRAKDGSTFEVPCDSAISSVGYIPNPLCEKQRSVHLVGDCNEVVTYVRLFGAPTKLLWLFEGREIR